MCGYASSLALVVERGEGVAVSVLLQDWITLEAETACDIIQSEPFWLCLGEFTEVALYTTTKECAGAARLAFESAPSDDEDLATVLAAVVLTADMQSLEVVRSDSLPVSPGEWLRWHLRTGGAGSVTFRVWASFARTAR